MYVSGIYFQSGRENMRQNLISHKLLRASYRAFFYTVGQCAQKNEEIIMNYVQTDSCALMQKRVKH